ncbi:MAG: nucleotidyltransferase [Bacteroidales bacterium]|nr:nucleotidyltransferase [Bacteroidales bacterium]
MKPTLLIMAAGMGSRYGGLKQLDGVGPKGETIMDFSVYDAIESGFGDVVFVVRKKFQEEFEEKVASKYKGIIPYTIVTQEPDDLPVVFMPKQKREKPWGTGQAVLAAKDVITKPFAVINSDDFYGRDAFKCLADHLSKLTPKDKGNFCMIGFYLNNTLSDSGSVSRGICSTDNYGHLTKVEEHSNIRREGDKILGEGMDGVEKELAQNSCTSMNMWGFTLDYMQESEKQFKEFLRHNLEDPKKEFYVPSAVSHMIDEGKANVKVIPTPSAWFGVTYHEDREKVVEKLKEMTNEGIYPSPLFK